ncbi:MAG TPA: hypothetical protein C5S50_04230 [Methanosarcinaceae archaeon]|nr:hypothetical protein [Methanosarcinaceae archaeon]
MNLTDNEKRDAVKLIEAGKPLPDKYRFLLFDDDHEVEEYWTGDFIFENEWQSFRTKKNRGLELKTPFHECKPERYKFAVKVVDIFGNDNMKIVEVSV